MLASPTGLWGRTWGAGPATIPRHSSIYTTIAPPPFVPDLKHSKRGIGLWLRFTSYGGSFALYHRAGPPGTSLRMSWRWIQIILWDSSSQPPLRRAASRSVKLIAQRVGVTERDVVEMNRRLQKVPLSRRELHVKSAFQPRKRHSECWQPIRKARWASFLGSE